MYVLSQSTLHGKKAGFYVTAGLCSGLILHTTLVVLTMTTLSQLPDTFVDGLKLLGVGYLLYLAWLSFHVTIQPITACNVLANTTLYRHGILMNISNPKIYLFFLVFLPQFVPVNSDAVAWHIGLLGGLFIVVTFLVFSAIAYAGGALQQRLINQPQIQQLLSRVVGVIFILLAISLLQ